MYRELRDAWRLERSSFKLHQISHDLYQRLSAYISRLSSSIDLKQGLAKRVASMELEVLKSLAHDLFSLRVKKALVQALEGYDPVPWLTREEAEALKRVLRALSEAESLFIESLSPQAKRVELKLVRIVREVPESEAPGLAPLSIESLALLPVDIANRLINEDYAVALE